MEDELVFLRTCEGYAPQPGGYRQDRETGLWFVSVFEIKTGPVQHGPFVTEDEARTALLELLGNLSS